MSIETHYLVRHGDYRWGDKVGDSYAKKSLEKLTSLGIEAGTLVLSSTTKRTMNTAKVIAEGLESEVIPSVRIRAAGESPRSIRNFDNFIALTLDENGIEASQLGSSLVVVTHSPLVEYVKAEGVDAWKYYSSYGQVVGYQAGSWRSYPLHGNLGDKWRIEDSSFTVGFERNIREEMSEQNQ